MSQKLQSISRKIISLALLLPSLAWGAGYTFDGADTKFTVGDSALLEATAFTMCISTYRTGAGENSSGVLLLKRNSGSGTGYAYYFFSTGYEFAVEATTDGVWRSVGATLNTWIRNCITYDGSSLSNDPIPYADGSSQSLSVDTNPTGTISIAGTDSFVIGNRSNDNVTYAGTLAWPAYWSRVLSANEIKADFVCGPKAIPTNLVGFWNLGDASGNNLTTNSLNATLTAGAGAVSHAGPPLHYNFETGCTEAELDKRLRAYDQWQSLIAFFTHPTLPLSFLQGVS